MGRWVRGTFNKEKSVHDVVYGCTECGAEFTSAVEANDHECEDTVAATVEEEIQKVVERFTEIIQRLGQVEAELEICHAELANARLQRAAAINEARKAHKALISAEDERNAVAAERDERVQEAARYAGQRDALSEDNEYLRTQLAWLRTQLDELRTVRTNDHLAYQRALAQQRLEMDEQLRIARDEIGSLMAHRDEQDTKIAQQRERLVAYGEMYGSLCAERDKYVLKIERMLADMQNVVSTHQQEM